MECSQGIAQSSVQASTPFVVAMVSVFSVIGLNFAAGIYIHQKPLYRYQLKILLEMMTALATKTAIWIVIVLHDMYPGAVTYDLSDLVRNASISFYYYLLLVSTCLTLSLAQDLFQRLMKRRVWMESLGLDYTAICWEIPAIVVCVWTAVMVFAFGSTSWKNHTKSGSFLIIQVPVLGCTLASLGCVIAILRGPLLPNPCIKKGKKFGSGKVEALGLCPIIGVSIFQFYCNAAEGVGEYCMVYDACFQSLQATLITVICCIMSSHPRKTVRGRMRRYYAEQERTTAETDTNCLQTLRSGTKLEVRPVSFIRRKREGPCNVVAFV